MKVVSSLHFCCRTRERSSKGGMNQSGVCFHPHWARSTLGRSIPLYFSPNFRWQKNERPLLLVGGVHGDEPEGVTLATKTLEWLTDLYKNSIQPNDLAPWVLIPCINIDGFTSNTRVNSRGVDLNRNFPSRDWSPSYKKIRYFPGPQPTSEVETRALITLLHFLNPRLVIHCHSWNPGIIFTSDSNVKEAEILAQETGYPLQSDIGYPTPGSLGQYTWHELKTPCICIEEQDHIDQALVWPHFEKGIKKIFGGVGS